MRGLESSPRGAGRHAIVRSSRWLVAAVALLGACASPPGEPIANPLATIDRSGAAPRVVLDQKAVERIGIRTAPVKEILTTAGRSIAIPYGALIYDPSGETFAYTNPEPLAFVRHRVRIRAIQGEQVVLSEGLPAGSAVVVVGAGQLLGIELGVGL